MSLSLRSIFLRPVSQFNQTQPKPQSFQNSPVPALANYDNVSDQVVNIVKSFNPMENALSSFIPYLNREIVTYVIRKQEENLKLGFRFFLWTTNWKRFHSWDSHNLVIDMIKRENGVDLYWEVLCEVKSANRRILSRAFAVLIDAYWKMKKTEKAVDAFGRMRGFGCEPDLFTYNMVLNILVKQDVVLLALAVYNTMLKINVAPSCSTYSILIDGMCRNGKIKDALQLFDEMKERGINPDKITNTVVLNGLCRAKKVEDAYLMFNSMRSSGSDICAVTYTALLNGVCKSGNMEQAISLLEDFKKDGYDLNLYSYSNLIDSLFKAKRTSEAVELFHQMHVDNITPNDTIYTIMIRGLCDAGMVKDAQKLFGEMTERQIAPTTWCYNTLIKGLCDAGRLDAAKSLKLKISENNNLPNVYTYTILICGMCKNGRVDEAKQLFDEMEKMGCSPSEHTYNALIDGLCKAKKLEEARMLLYKMEIGKNTSLFFRLSQGPDRVLDSESLQAMVEKLCASNSILKAYNLLTRLADSGVVPSIQTYNTLINGFCRAENMDTALKLFKELQIKDLSPDSITYCTLVNGLCMADRIDDSLSVLEQMIGKRYNPDISVYICIMTWSSRKGKILLSFSVWLRYLRSLPDREEEIIKSAELDFGKGQHQSAIRKLLEMDVKSRRGVYNPYTIWLIGFCQIQKPFEALKIFNLLNEFGVLVSAPSCTWLISSFCRKYKLIPAVKVFLYSLEKGIILRRSKLCNDLLCRLLQFRGKLAPNKQYLAIKITKKMKSGGYKLNEILYPKTKNLLRYYKKKLIIRWTKLRFVQRRAAEEVSSK